MPNRLARETSPYLRQHADNPVDWYAWGDEAFERARNENKPVLLSIGYSACHWCHVMAHECFENPEIAALMNDRFINIKVDREERPDLDHIYQNVAQLITRSGGWPLTVFLTPDRRPFFGGTYFPPEDRHGRPGFPRVLQSLSDAFANDKPAIEENVGKLMATLGRLESLQAPPGVPDRKALQTLADDMLKKFDWAHGGFGHAPKFPNTMNLSFLWRFGLSSGFVVAQEAAIVALSKMARGGIFDHLGGGFARYSTDEKWLIPHFEKMLYDNALLMRLYAEVLLTSDGPLRDEDRALFLDVVARTVEYVLREMTATNGSFFSAQDADSEGVEGQFFVWTTDELRRLLSPSEFEAFSYHYGVTAAGNFEHSSTVLSELRQLSDTASHIRQSAESTGALLREARRKLFETRDKRVHPATDDKALTGWNSLMISALAWAAEALQRSGARDHAQRARTAAERGFEFLSQSMATDDHLRGVWKDGEARLNAHLDDYAFFATAALDLARFEQDPARHAMLVDTATRWTDHILKHFKATAGGFHFTSDDHETLIQRPRSLHDQAQPAGSAVTASLVTELAALRSDPRFTSAKDKLIAELFTFCQQFPLGMGETASAALLWVAGPVTVTGPARDDLPVHPFLFAIPNPESNSWVVCHRETCATPVSSVEEAATLIRERLMLK